MGRNCEPQERQPDQPGPPETGRHRPVESGDLNHDGMAGRVLVGGAAPPGFANVEEDFADQAVWESGALSRDKHVMPWRIEDELKKLGANYIQAGLWKGFAIRDVNLITGQQNFSGTETAQLMIQTLGH